MPLKVLDPEAEGGFAKKLKRLISANRAYFLLVGTAHYLENLEKAGEAGHPFLMPVVDYSLITYAGFCCTNPLRDSSCESSVVAGRHEQTDTPRLQDQELARL